jgi:lipopolysaccharide biosynthesis glycosyltransferase
MAASNGPIVPVSDDRYIFSIGKLITSMEKLKSSVKMHIMNIL